jgi:hypothetical protein
LIGVVAVAAVVVAALVVVVTLAAVATAAVEDVVLTIATFVEAAGSMVLVTVTVTVEATQSGAGFVPAAAEAGFPVAAVLPVAFPPKVNSYAEINKPRNKSKRRTQRTSAPVADAAPLHAVWSTFPPFTVRQTAFFPL